MRHFFIILFLSALSLASEINQDVELTQYMNARYSAQFRYLGDFDKQDQNIQGQLAVGTRGRVQEIKRLASGNLGLLLLVKDGEFKNQKLWVYYNKAAPRMKLIDQIKSETSAPVQAEQVKKAQLAKAQLAKAQLAKAKIKNRQNVVSQAVDYYNNQRYGESLGLLETIKSSRNQNLNWYYYYALNQTRMNNYEEALLNFETFIKNSSTEHSAKAYYYMGLVQFYKGDYEKALNSLELSLDISTDPKLDNFTEDLIEKTIRYQNYYEKNKKTNMTFLLGYVFDTNALNLSPGIFASPLAGHIFSYGASISHKAIDRYSFIFEPTLAIADSYTFDNSFKSNSLLPPTDALQLLVSAPIRFYFEEKKLSNKFEISLNAYNIYFPINTASRELSLTSIFLKTQILTPYSADYTVKYNLNVASDKSHGNTSAEDDASGLRVDFLTTFVQYLSKKNITNLFYDLGVDHASANGINARSNKYSMAVGYMYPSFSNTLSSIRLGYHYLAYPDKVVPRMDNQLNFAYSVSKELLTGSSLNFSVRIVGNSSNIELSKYADATVGVQYTKSLGF